MSTTIYVVNRSTLVSNVDARAMAVAVNAQVYRDVAPAWSLPRIPVLFAATTPPRGSRVISLVDTADDPQALGYHTEIGAVQSGVVGCKPELDQGAHPLTGPYSVSSILSHEVLEMAVDPRCNLWADSGRGYLVAYEVGDPVQSDHYDMAGVTVSNFALPSWFDPLTPAGVPVDHMGTIRSPFQLAHGGYCVRLADGAVSQVFGEGMPEWLRATKRVPASRAARRSGP